MQKILLSQPVLCVLPGDVAQNSHSIITDLQPVVGQIPISNLREYSVPNSSSLTNSQVVVFNKYVMFQAAEQ